MAAKKLDAAVDPAQQEQLEKQYVDEIVSKVKKAQEIFANYSQDQVDAIFKAAAAAASSLRIPLAQMAVEETGMGVVEDKIIKNHYASEYIYNKYLPVRTCGVIEEDDAFGMIKVAEPRGVIAGVIPTTNPTSTAIFKALITLKTRNGIVFSPHPRARKCTCEAARVVLEAAVKAGAPEGIIGWIENPTMHMSGYLMKHKDVSLILATGGPGMVKAAYSSGTPAVGVGAGNTPVIMDDTCDVEMAVSSILLSKTFDNGMICASEQSVTVMDPIYDAVKKEFGKRGGYILTAKEANALRKIIKINGKLNSGIVGQTAVHIAEMAGLKVPAGTKVLIAEVKKVGDEEPFSCEKLSPVLALYRAKSYEEAAANGKALLQYGGLGHTAVLYTNTQNEERIREFGHLMLASRVLINSPSSHGGIGDLYNFALDPSLTLGCGSWGGNYVSENVGPKNLINIKSIAKRRENMLWFQIPQKVYFKYGCLCTALGDLKGKKRAFIVTDKFLSNSGVMKPMLRKLDELGIRIHIFDDVEPDPTIRLVRKGTEQLASFGADVILAFGGGSPIDAAKLMWLMYEHPEVRFEDVAARFMDIRKRISRLPELGEKAMFVAVPTTSGTGSEVTPFAVITDEETQQKYPLADYALTPDMAIIDTELVMKLPKGLTAISGIDALTHALEARVSCMQSDYCNALANEAVKLIFENLPVCYQNGPMSENAREHMFNASAMAGMAFANAFLGLCHSTAHKLGGMYHIPHGLANAFMIEHIIRFNAVDNMTKQAAFPQYHYPNAKADYAAVARYLGLNGKTDDELVEQLILKVRELKKTLDIPSAMKEYLDKQGVTEKQFLANLDELSVNAYDDQCTGANPRYPLISEIKDLYLKAYYGK